MKNNIPKISVVVITYKQEHLIGRALESLISQRDYLYEICVSDDCSPDRTWDILIEYKKKYPDLIRLHRNEVNVGIFANFENAYKMPTGDIIYRMAGDDEAGASLFKRVIEFIDEHKIDYKTEMFCIYSDYQVRYPNGDSIIFYNKSIQTSPKNALRLSLRGIICGRGSCFSINVLKAFDKVSLGRSHIVEHVQDRQLQINATENYYLSTIGNIYYANIGVSAHIDNEIYKERLEIWPFTIKYLTHKGIIISRSDWWYSKFNIAMQKFRHHMSVSNLFNLIWTYINSRDFTLPIGNRFRHLYFAILRRIPHTRTINFL